MVRGIERRSIFMDDMDRSRFLSRLETALLATGTGCYAWALMPNHAHLLLRTGPTPLAVAMHRLCTTYGMDFNRRYERVGHLFQNRYKALPVESDRYLLELIRYIHLNPVRAGIVPCLEALEFYEWTGHRVLMGMGSAPFQAVDTVLREFGRSVDEARSRLRQFMALSEEGEGPSDEPRAGPSPPGRTAAPFGDPPHPGRREGPLLPAAGSLCPRSMNAQTLRELGWDLPRLIRHVCDVMEVDDREIASGRRIRRVSKARAVIAWLAWTDLGISQDEMSRYLGAEPQSLSGRMQEGRRLAEEFGVDPFRDLLRADQGRSSGG